VATQPFDFQKEMADDNRRGDAPRVSPARRAGAADVMPTGRELAGYQERVFEIVRLIPPGRVMTYGQIAEMLGEGYTPRTVGFVMHNADDTVPWHRVINSQGGCSTNKILLPENKQQLLLEAEGVGFNEKGRCDLARLRWSPGEAEGGGPAREADAQATLFDD
jgi:methylated-DNA-protein-cysteine methyltransferase related protein